MREIEHGSFSPFVFSTTGGMGTTAMVVYKRIASMISEKYERPYSKTMQWIRCRLSYSLLHSAIMCLRGTRSSRHHPEHHPISGGSIDLVCSMGRVCHVIFGPPQYSKPSSKYHRNIWTPLKYMDPCTNNAKPRSVDLEDTWNSLTFHIDQVHLTRLSVLYCN